MLLRIPRWLSALVLMAGLASVVPMALPASAQSVDAKKAQAAALENKIREQGKRLSLSAEDFNEARFERERLEARADAARADVVTAENRWGAYRSQLGRRARNLYMHPGATIEAFFGAKSLGEVARAHVYGGEVLLTDTELVMGAERARHEVMQRARSLNALRSAAERKEDELAARRSQVQRELGSQRALLSNVKGDIAELVAAERARQAAAEAQIASGSASADTAPAAQPLAAVKPKAEEPAGPPPGVKGSASKAVATAAAQIGKPYEWAAAGPDSFDCSGLTMYAWNAAGVSLPHSSRAQYSSLPHVARGDIQPGDLLFYGNPIHHVGIYEGGGTMINAPETGEHVRRDSIGRSDYAGAARP